ncbi:hypothetical protein LTR84_001364 [Exophiala bonariae]|uniref:Zn(2)-C6 fungal-type domain-containing protein n=1 Tax=Exophiala bonariae TaxID=1690606 RepID=A0AAV9NCD6_9EURO|nr:hypothetical protein LTR84_001364 [Exophiala bonariae]
MDNDHPKAWCPTPEAPAASAPDLGVQETTPAYRTSMRKHRASVACNYCRFRKVKCSVVGGNPCYNCILEQVECVLPQRRPRGKPKAQIPSVAPRVISPAVPKSIRPATEPASTWSESRITPDLPRHIDESVSPTPIPPPPRDTLGGDISSKSWSTHETIAPDCNFDWYAAATQSLTSPISSDETIAPSNARVHLSYTAFQDQDLSSLVQPTSSDFSVEDLVYLRQKGALTLPDPDLRNDLLKSYVDLVHPCLPLIDLNSFQASIRNPARHGRISLLLLQAIMFSASAWADVKLVRQAGFLTRDEMRRAFYLKTKLLYDFNYERDRIAIVQSLVLLTTWWVTPTEQKDGYYWCSLALAVAKSIGLHRDAHSEGLSASVRKLRRRIWWCCLMRDALTSLGTNRAPRVQSHDFTVTPLTLEDMHHSDNSLNTNSLLNSSDQAQAKLASIFIASTKLCRILSTIIDLLYAENPIGHIGILYPKQDNKHNAGPTHTRPVDGLEKLEMCEQDLQQWRDQMPDDLLHQFPVPVITSSAEEAMIIHRALLAMLYLVAQFCLHRPRALADRMGLGASQNQIRGSQTSMRAAAESLNKIVMDLYRVDLMRRLPGTSISCILTISWSHVFDLQSPSDEVRRGGARRFEECKLALRELVDTNVAAEWAIGFLDFAASHVSRLFKKKQIRLIPQDGELGRTMSSSTQHIATPATSKTNANSAVASEAPAQDCTNTNLFELQTRQGSGVGPLDYEDLAVGSGFNLPDDDLFNLDFSNLTDMWVAMPTIAWDPSRNSPSACS